MQDFAHLYKIGSLLLDCVCDTMAQTEAGCPDRRGWVPGLDAEAVNCCDPGGQLTINIRNAYPSKQFPIVNTGSPTNCDDPYWVVMYQLTALRCMPVGDMQHAPTVDALDDTAYRDVLDRAAMRTGVYCCLTNREVAEPVIGAGYQWIFGDHTSYGPEGGCVGSKLLILVGVPTCWDCT